MRERNGVFPNTFKLMHNICLTITSHTKKRLKAYENKIYHSIDFPIVVNMTVWTSNFLIQAQVDLTSLLLTINLMILPCLNTFVAGQTNRQK